MRMFAMSLGLAIAALGMSRSATAALINIANGVPVVANGGVFPNPAYAVANVTNGLNASPDNNTGTIYENNADGSYWLATNSQTSDYFVLDLGSQQSIGSFQIFNTHNGPAGDSGTGNFTITGSNILSNLSGSSITGGTQLASGTLSTPPATSADITPNSFTSSSAGPFEYIRFDALTAASVNTPVRVGLNEIRIFAVPEPGSLSLLAVAVVGLMARSRRVAPRIAT